MPAESKHVYNFDGLKYWAEKGQIVLVDEHTGDKRFISCVDWLKRAEAIGRQADRESYPNERNKFIRVANEMEKCAKEAADQGDPFDEKVMEFRRRHKLWRKHAQVPANTSSLILPKPKRLILPSNN